MSIKPILFNTEMVRAILDGRKTQTRRLIRMTDGIPLQSYSDFAAKKFISYGASCNVKKAPCESGDILWVRETWNGDWCERYIYKADGGSAIEAGYEKEPRWYPSIHMPKKAARIFLRVKGVRAERLWDMDEEAAIAEGFEDSSSETDSPLQRFSDLWDKTINRDDLCEYGYHANPWVWVIDFERCERPEGW